MARIPDKPPRIVKQIPIVTRTTEAVKRQAEIAAAADGRSLSSWVEQLILAALKETK